MKKVKSVAEYFAAAPAQSRAGLKKLRATIRAVVPGAAEIIYYQMPTFKEKRAIVAYGAFSDHCSLFPLSSSVLAKFKKDLAGYETSKGTIRIPFDNPLPSSIVRKIVKARIAQIKERERKSPGRKP